MKHIARLTILAIMAMLFAIPASAESIRVYAAKPTVKCYASATTSSRLLGMLGYGESVMCIGVDGDWALVQADSGAEGFCRIDELTTEDPNHGSLTAYVVSGGAMAYARPDASSRSAQVDGGTKLTVIAMTNDREWCRVTKSGVYAYMRTDDLATEAPADQELPPVQSATAYATDNTIRIYSSASRSSGSVAVASYGERLICTAVDGSWARVEYGGKTGWCYVSKLSLADPNTASLTVYPRKAGVKIYSRPESSASAIYTLNTGDSLTCVCATPDGEWLRVTASGKYGYVRADDMSTVRADDTSEADELIELALAQLGKPYVYATRGPNSFDCSGLTLYCFREVADITLGRSAQSQGYNERFPKIERISDLQRGDIVCFNTEETDSDLTDHVGIYLGDGKFVHASSARGEVIISTMSSGYYRRVFTWGRRLLD